MKVRELMEEVRQLSVWTPVTLKTYKACVNLLCAEFAHRDPDLEEISAEWLTAYRAKCLATLSPVTFNSRRRHFSVLWKHAVLRNYVRENVFHLVKPAPVPRAPKAIPADVFTNYVQALSTASRELENGTRVELFPPQFFWLAMVKTFYSTGMRQRQLVGLKWKDIDFASRSICLRAATSKTKREWSVPISDSLQPTLDDLRRRTVEIVGQDLANRQVFCLPLFSKNRFKTDRMTGDHVMKFFARFHSKQNVGAFRMTAHKIRHTTATHLLRGNSSSVKVVQDLLGHTTPLTTLQYVHPDLEELRKAVNLL